MSGESRRFGEGEISAPVDACKTNLEFSIRNPEFARIPTRHAPIARYREQHRATVGTRNETRVTRESFDLPFFFFFFFFKRNSCPFSSSWIRNDS